MTKGLLLAVLEALEWVIATALAIVVLAATVAVQTRLDKVLGVRAASISQGEGATQHLQRPSVAQVH
jgi:hypothetical protein